MLNAPVLTKVIRTFPSVQLSGDERHLPVDVSLITQLGHGAGDHVFANVSFRQRNHERFVDELSEPSAKIGAPHFDRGDATSLYSFTVGPEGHPFHRHAGHRIFTAISGSGGAQLRFSMLDDATLAKGAEAFLKTLRFINIPPDCLFTVRFGGNIWHQFAPIIRGSRHPVMFALSCHTDELGGDLNDELKAMVLSDESDIPTLTELLDDDIGQWLERDDILRQIPTVSLSLDAPHGTLHRLACNLFRGNMGTMRQGLAKPFDKLGFTSFLSMGEVSRGEKLPPESLLPAQFPGQSIDHQDINSIRVSGIDGSKHRAGDLLEAVLEGFLFNPPVFVGRLIGLRNLLVMPMGLRRSPLGCPVSSLIGPATGNLFRGRYPVLDQQISDSEAQVVLGADDRHLSFRSGVSVTVVGDHELLFSLENAVHCTNRFGHFYMGAIRAVHRRLIAPAMLRHAVGWALRDLS